METNNVRPASLVVALRQQLRMTQEEFAHALGVTVSTVNRWENGHVAPSRLARKAMEGLSVLHAQPATNPEGRQTTL